MGFSYPPVHTNEPKLKSDCYEPMAVLLQLRELVGGAASYLSWKADL